MALETEPAAALPPARAALQRLGEAIGLAQAERDAVAREHAPIAEVAQRVMALTAAHRAALRALADEEDDVRYAERQQALRGIEAELDGLRPQADLIAFRIAQGRLDEHNVRLSRLAQQHEELLYLAAQEAAEEFVFRHVAPVYAQAIRMRGVVDLLGRAIEARGYGNNPSSTALRIGQAILRRVAEVIPAITVAGDRVAAEDFLRRLGEDPTAELAPPAYEAEWSLDPIRSMADPLPDGSKFINRPQPAAGPELGGGVPTEFLGPAESGSADPAAVPPANIEEPHTAPAPSTAEGVSLPTLVPMPDVTLPPWLDTAGSAWAR
jgi:hypothetical protein